MLIRKMECIVMALVLMLMLTNVNAYSVECVPSTDKVVIGTFELSGRVNLNVTLPVSLTIRWWSSDVNGTILGILDENAFNIIMVEVNQPVNDNIEVCSFFITKFALRITMTELPKLDVISARVNDEEVMCKYDPLNRSLEVSCENVTLPAKVHVRGKVGDNDFITFAGVVDIDGSLRVNELQLLTPQPIYLKVMVERVTRIIPIIIRPMYAQAEESSSSSTGYELIGRPIGLDVVLVKLTILGDDQPITATLTVMYDGEKIELLANKTIILTLPKGKHVVFRVNAEGYRQVEKTIETTSNMDLEVKLEKIGVWDYLVMALSNIAHYLSHPIYVMLLVIGIAAFVALIVVLARR